MKKLFLGFIAVLALTVVSIVSCKKSEQTPISTPADNDIVLLGNYIPFSYNVNGKEDATVGFLQSAQPFSVDPSKAANGAYVDLLKAGIDKSTPVEVYVYRNTRTIAKVKPASDEAMARYRQALVAPAKTEALPTIPSEAALTTLFNQLKAAPIPFKFASDGCYARAHKMRQMILAAGYDADKLFVYGNLAASTGTCCVSWSYHVAPLVNVKTANGTVQQRILDPSLFTAPVAVSTWLNACRNTGCVSTANYTTTRQMPGAVYFIASTGNSPLYDNSYAHTNCVIAGYTGLVGCGIPPTLNCPL
ncbi:hypothetical protein KTO58_11340 [Chitinophaga pendula]|uniref:protein-glutamine glutaminase family protein n=1 Tax=Chitinophaga TaxID=79328 RepID=UPI000BAFD67D|nr:MULTISPECIES: protein-glutamine glutaminase family protein [Chitinophaga]ASZ12630.1 hypothetical protein CK934_17545 [Chitinophaga sp. MD30]UCJ09760.1 hypothetical protein KTO58_11340 [Chitinophaga pendula]